MSFLNTRAKVGPTQPPSHLSGSLQRKRLWGLLCACDKQVPSDLQRAASVPGVTPVTQVLVGGESGLEPSLLSRDQAPPSKRGSA